MKALIHENVALAPLTTFHIGGPARYFIEATDENTVLDAIHWAKEKNLPVFVLGGGSNVLVADTGFPGLVIKIGIRGIHWAANSGDTIVRAGAGEQWDPLVESCVARGLAGVECLSGIPGFVGGTPIQNVGAYGQEVSQVVKTVRVYDRSTDRITDLSNAQCRFTYRTSIFNTIEQNRYVVLAVTYGLKPDGAPAIRYAELQEEFGTMPAKPTLADVRAAVRRIRARKAMLLVEGDPDCRSAGSFFKNPIITERQFAALHSIAEGVPRYPAAPGKVKTAAAWLIERAGFQKGYSIGPAGLSTKHTLALINKGGAKADDVLRLAREIRARVRERFGIELIPEPVLLGFETGF